MKVVVSTCDEYGWLIPVFMYFYRKYWPDNPHETIIITEFRPLDGLVYYTNGEAWSTGILNYIKQTKEEKFILFMEDMLLRKDVDTKRVKEAEKLCRGDIGSVRLSNRPTRYFRNHPKPEVIGAFRRYSLGYRFATGIQPAIYQKEYLCDFFREGESAWETERNGVKRLVKLKSKWRLFWPETNITDTHPIGIMKKGKLYAPVLRGALSELRDDATIESTEIYNILQRRITFEVGHKQ